MRTVWLNGMAGLCLLATVEANAAAVAPTHVLGLDMRDPRCTVQAAALDEAQEQSAGEVRGLNDQLATMAKFQKFMDSRKWKPKVSIGEQMTPSEANEFGNLQEQTKIGIFAMLLEGKRGRDIRVFGRVADMASQMQAGYQPPADANSEEFSLAGILVIGREKFQLTEEAELDILVESQGKCSLQNALIAQARRVFDSIVDLPGLQSASDDMAGLQAKHGQRIDRSKLNDSEKLLYDRTTKVIDAVLKGQPYYKDLLFISRLDAVSKLQRDTRRQSQYEAPGENAHINVVWNAWVKEGKITPDQDSLSRIVNFINEKFPTDMMKQMSKEEASK